MSIVVLDPEGTRWTVSREWSGLPGWARERSDSLDPAGLDVPLVGDVGDDSGILAAIVVAVAIVVLLVVLVFLLVPLLVLLVGVLVALLALAARLLSLSAWSVRAQSEARSLTWRVRGLSRSRRAMRTVAAMLERGEAPMLAGARGAASAVD